MNVGPFSLQQVGLDPVNGLFQNFIDVPPFQFADHDGNTNAAIFTKYGVTTVNLTRLRFTPVCLTDARKGLAV